LPNRDKYRDRQYSTRRAVVKADHQAMVDLYNLAAEQHLSVSLSFNSSNNSSGNTAHFTPLHKQRLMCRASICQSSDSELFGSDASSAAHGSETVAAPAWASNKGTCTLATTNGSPCRTARTLPTRGEIRQEACPRHLSRKYAGGIQAAMKTRDYYAIKRNLMNS
jgi:hypothetical protein